MAVPDERQVAMPEPRTYLYEPYVAVMENGREVLVQIFRDPTSGQVTGQISFRQAGGCWGAPYQLEVR